MKLLNILKDFMSLLNAGGNYFLMKQKISPVLALSRYWFVAGS